MNNTTRETKVYECISISDVKNVHGGYSCKMWKIEVVNDTNNQLIPLLSQQEQSVLTVQILAFMAFVFVLKTIKRSI